MPQAERTDEAIEPAARTAEATRWRVPQRSASRSEDCLSRRGDSAARSRPEREPSAARWGLVVVVLVLLLQPTMATASDTLWAPAFPTQQQARVYLDIFKDGGGYYLESSGGGNVLRRTTDGGVSWSEIAAPPAAGSMRMDFATSKVGYIVASNLLFRTGDGGSSWQEVAPPSRDFVEWEALSTSRSGRTIALIGRLWKNSDGTAWREGQCHDLRHDEVLSYVSRNGGMTWERGVVSSEPAGVFDSAFAGPLSGVAVVSTANVYEPAGGECQFGGSSSVAREMVATDDGGRTWRKVLDCPGTASCLGVAITSRKHFATVTTDSKVLVTFDGGATFEAAPLDGLAEAPIREHLRWGQGVAFGTKNVGYVSTNGRGVWRTTDGGRTWERETTPHDVPGYSFGTVAAAGTDLALAGGPNFVIRRMS